MKLELEGVNWLAVLAAGAATFFLGAIWYQALFGRLWKELHGYSSEQLKALQAKRPPALFFGGMIAAYLLLAGVMAVFAVALGLHGWRDGAVFGGLLWLGPALVIGFTAWLASDKHIGILAIDAAYQLVFLVMMGVILGGWK